jgi:hypothetical protein
VIAERLTAQLLAGPPARDPVAVAERRVAIQGQDSRGARLAIRDRTSGRSADVNRALTEDRSLLAAASGRWTRTSTRPVSAPAYDATRSSSQMMFASASSVPAIAWTVPDTIATASMICRQRPSWP